MGKRRDKKVSKVYSKKWTSARRETRTGALFCSRTNPSLARMAYRTYRQCLRPIFLYSLPSSEDEYKNPKKKNWQKKNLHHALLHLAIYKIEASSRLK